MATLLRKMMRTNTTRPFLRTASTCSCSSSTSTLTSTRSKPRRQTRKYHSSPTKHAPTHHGSSTFVSKHFKIEEHTIKDFFKRVKAKSNRSNTHFVMEECPTCPPHKGKADNKWKLYVSHQNNGAYFCHRCGSKGSWFDLKGLLTGKPGHATTQRKEKLGSTSPPSKYKNVPLSAKQLTQAQGQGGPTLPLPDQQAAGQFPTQLMENPKYEAVLHYLTEERGLSRETLTKYCVGGSEYSFRDGDGIWSKQLCMTFPWITPIGRYQSESGQTGTQWQITRLKTRALKHKHMQRLEPGGGGWGLFGWHTVPDTAKSIVLTEGEFDAMAVHQATGVPTVSLPNGCQSLPVEVLPLLERFDKIYLWMDDDVPGREGAEKFANKLGPNRCLIVRPLNNMVNPPKDANDALLQKLNMRELIESALPMPHKEILTFAEVRHELRYQLANPLQAAGKQFSTLPSMNTLLKGHRRGELTVITGPTGAGKTTFLSQMSLDLCQQGVNTLWGSFEIKNIQLMKKMLMQYAGDTSALDDSMFEHVADGFDELPMYFMRFYGSTEIDEVLDAMEYAVYVYDVEHILLDNLQFMLSSQMANASGFQRFEAQEQALEKFRRFGKQKESIVFVLTFFYNCLTC